MSKKFYHKEWFQVSFIILPSYMIIVAPLLWYFLSDFLWLYIRILLSIYAVTSGLLLFIGDGPRDRVVYIKKEEPKKKTNNYYRKDK